MYRNRLTAMAVTVPKNTVAKVLWKNPWIRHRKGNEPRSANNVFTFENLTITISNVGIRYSHRRRRSRK